MVSSNPSSKSNTGPSDSAPRVDEGNRSTLSTAGRVSPDEGGMPQITGIDAAVLRLREALKTDARIKGRQFSNDQPLRPSSYQRDAKGEFIYNEDGKREFTPEAKQYFEKFFELSTKDREPMVKLPEELDYSVAKGLKRSKQSKRNADHKLLFGLGLNQHNLDLYLKKHNLGPDPTCRTAYVAAETTVLRHLRERFNMPYLTGDAILSRTYKSVISFYNNHNHREFEGQVKQEHVDLILSELEVDPPLWYFAACFPESDEFKAWKVQTELTGYGARS